MQPAVDWLFARAHAVDIILMVLVIEFAGLMRLAGWPARDAALRLLPGALMMIALRGALTGLTWPWIALPLALSFPAHLADLAQGRGRRRTP